MYEAKNLASTFSSTMYYMEMKHNILLSPSSCAFFGATFLNRPSTMVMFSSMLKLEGLYHAQQNRNIVNYYKATGQSLGWWFWIKQSNALT